MLRSLRLSRRRMRSRWSRPGLLRHGMSRIGRLWRLWCGRLALRRLRGRRGLVGCALGHLGLLGEAWSCAWIARHGALRVLGRIALRWIGLPALLRCLGRGGIGLLRCGRVAGLSCGVRRNASRWPVLWSAGGRRSSNGLNTAMSRLLRWVASGRCSITGSLRILRSPRLLRPRRPLLLRVGLTVVWLLWLLGGERLLGLLGILRLGRIARRLLGLLILWRDVGLLGLLGLRRRGPLGNHLKEPNRLRPTLGTAIRLSRPLDMESTSCAAEGVHGDFPLSAAVTGAAARAVIGRRKDGIVEGRNEGISWQRVPPCPCISTFQFSNIP